MNLHQFRFVREAVRQKFNLTEAAKVLYTSQPGVSKAIIELEEELGIAIFTRHGKRIRGLTEPGRAVLHSVERIMTEVDSLKKIGQEFAAHDSGSFTIATTHTQARYMLPKVIQEFKRRYPKIHLSLLQGSPQQISELVKHDQADVAIATESLDNSSNLVTLPCYQWEHLVVVPPDHPLLAIKNIALDDLIKYPIITYDAAFSGRSKIDHAFSLREMKPDIVLEAIDADVIKTYVELGMGIGIIAGIAFDAERDRHLRAIPVGHLFGTNVSRVGLKQGAYLRDYIYTFLELLSPTLSHDLIEKMMNNMGEDNYEL